MVPPPPPLHITDSLPREESEALSAMLMSWYMSGFHTGKKVLPISACAQYDFPYSGFTPVHTLFATHAFLLLPGYFQGLKRAQRKTS